MPDNLSNDGGELETAVDEGSLEWGTSSFEPGSDVGLVARHTVGLIERDNPSTRARLWALVADDAPLDDVLDELSSTGLKALPDFGLVQAEGAAVRVVARGRASISAERASGDVRDIDATGVRTWIEEVISDVVAVTITLPPLDDDPAVGLSSEAFAVLAGSIPARSITRRFDVADAHAADADGWSGSGAWGSPADGPVDAATPDPSTELDASPDVELAMVEPEGDTGDGDEWFDRSDAAASSPVPPQPADPQPADSQPADPQPADPQPAPPPPPDLGRATPQPGGPPGPGPGPGGPPPDVTVVVGPNDGPTQGPSSSLLDTGAGDEDEPGDTIVPEARAAWGVLAFSNGVRIAVDRSVLIGRNPKVRGDVEGELPHLMKFDGPGQGLSRTHAEIRVENGEMLLEDLQSTNGTEVQLPGQQRRRLRSGEPVVVVPGTLIDFGEELHCTVETVD